MKSVVFILSLFILGICSCRDKCEDLEVGSICSTSFTFDIRGEADTNVFKNVYNLDDFLLIDSLNQPVGFESNPYRKLISFRFFNCELEEAQFDQVNYKVYYFKYGSSQVDQFKVAYKPVKSRSTCGGTRFEMLKFYFRGKVYDGRDQSVTYVLKR